ncbi:hypothetical protein MMC25_000400 [Agyrium rufum]|nr:hypothetical protein [Agyrium rufum]
MAKTMALDEKGYVEALKDYEKSSFYPADILQECPQFRILVIGQTGAGKSTICSKVFGVSDDHAKTTNPLHSIPHVSHHSRGTKIHQVWQEITFPGQNEDIILHDSGGFEAANEAGFNEICKFLEYRLKRTTLVEQLHCIWYCIPLTGHRHIQSAEEKFFQHVYVGNIPVVAVFTHFDELENAHEFALMKRHQREHPTMVIPSDLAERAHALAVRDYDERERPALEKIAGPKVAIRRVAMPSGEKHQGVDDLIRATFDTLTKDGSLRRLWTAAQQQSAELKRIESIEIATEYLSTVKVSNSIPLLPFVGGGMFAKSFNRILARVSEQYGLLDPERVLQRKETRRRFYEACLKLSWAGRIGTSAGLAVNILGPLTVPFVIIALLKMAAGLILIHEDLFWRQRAENGLYLTMDVVDQITSNFAEGIARDVAARQIEGSIDITNCYRTSYCRAVLETAIRVARDEEAWHNSRSKTANARSDEDR